MLLYRIMNNPNHPVDSDPEYQITILQVTKKIRKQWEF